MENILNVNLDNLKYVVTEDGEIVEGIELIERPPVMEFKEA